MADRVDTLVTRQAVTGATRYESAPIDVSGLTEADFRLDAAPGVWDAATTLRVTIEVWIEVAGVWTFRESTTITGATRPRDGLLPGLCCRGRALTDLKRGARIKAVLVPDRGTTLGLTLRQA